MNARCRRVRLAGNRTLRRTPCHTPPPATARNCITKRRPRHAARVRARIFRRLPQLGGADALLQPPLPLRGLQCARLSAVGRAEIRARSIRKKSSSMTSPTSCASSSSAKRTSSAARWAVIRRSISAFVTRRARVRSPRSAPAPVRIRSCAQAFLLGTEANARRFETLGMPRAARERQRRRRARHAIAERPARLRRIPAL